MTPDRLAHHIPGNVQLVEITLKEILRRTLAALFLLSVSQVANAQTALPQDPWQTCLVSNLSDWFMGTVTPNGVVYPPDNLVGIRSAETCEFYSRSARMFLWLTSPPPAGYGQGPYVFNSSVFYDVSPRDSSGQRVLTNGQKSPDVNLPQVGPQSRPVVFDSTGKMRTFVYPEAGPTGKPAIRNIMGELIEIARTMVSSDGKPIFLDQAGRPIEFQIAQDGSPRLLGRSGQAIDFQPGTVMVNGKQVFLDKDGAIIELEQGQARGGVLTTQGNGLVYYLTQVNDVYAYFLTGAKTGGITPPPLAFPSSEDELNKIKQFAQRTFLDERALAVEVKSAWIEVTGPEMAKNYITMRAKVLAYDTSNSNEWIPNGQKDVDLALVGMHVVFSMKNHPEMVWATFEHVNNTPNAGYSYTDDTYLTKTVTPDTSGSWLFARNGGNGAANSRRMHLESNRHIKADQDDDQIGPSNLLRLNPWGAGASANGHNTSLVSLNNSIMRQLASNDVRKNYILIGATWTNAGVAPPGGAGAQQGSQQLANSTMESFLQSGSNGCFGCHDGTSTMLGSGGSGLSHIYGDLKPLQ